MRLFTLLFLAACTGTATPPAPPPPCVTGQCFSPPLDQCDGDLLVRYDPVGTCEDSGCVYDEVLISCADQDAWCEDRSCQPYEIDCDCYECTSPPLNICQDSSTLLAYDSEGTCDYENQCRCEYATTPVICDEGCFDGACNAPLGVALPDTCDSDEACGDAGSCVDDVCICAEGTRDCDGGCCQIVAESTPLPGTSANTAKLVYPLDALPWIALRQPAPDFGPGIEAVGLYRYNADEQALELQPNRMEVRRDSKAFDIAYSRRLGLYVTTIGSTDLVRLFRHAPYRRVSLGRAGPSYDVAMAVDSSDDVWAAWTPWSAEADTAYRVRDNDTGSVVSTDSLAGARSLDLAANPANHTVHAYWQSPTDDAQAWQHSLLTAATAASLCNKGNGEFSRTGVAWSVVPATAETDARLCRNGVFVDVSDLITTPTFPGGMTDIAFTLSRDDTAFLAFYNPLTGTVHWASSRDGLRWAQGTLPTTYNTEPSDRVHVALAARRLGGVGVLAVPSHPDMGDAQLYEFR